jgi:hypothetical protein
MPAYAAVSRQTHAGKGWRRHEGYGFAAGEAVLPLVGAEFARAAVAMPIAFVGQDGAFRPMAVLSLVPGRNLFVGPDGKWLGGYVPAVLRGHPFALVRPEGAAEAILCVDEASGLVVEAGTPGAEPFFDAEGNPAPPVRQVLDFLSQLDANRIATGRAVAALAAAEALAPWPLEVETPEGRKAVAGLFRVDEARLNALDGETFLGLRAVGALPLAYAQLLSMGQLSVFQTLAQLQAQLAQIHAQQRQTIEQSFVTTPTESLSFTWDNL